MTTPEAPAPGLSPTDVVLAQLAGLRSEPRVGAAAGRGVHQVWAFASPGNRAATGPVQRFAAMLRGSAYAALLEHRAAQLGPLVDRGDEAQVEVLVLGTDDRTVGFTWVLARQRTGAYAGCWLTEGVVRHPDEGEL
ncbi:MAG TPA: DUF4864 domain-containing protein [Mycobacteriales bacterium]|jgi:hypothetical protein|nr:DUF4864 domain-containing protein [Mycobacteriales bacterium]